MTVKKNRALPLKAQLFDSDGNPITDLDIVAPPVIQVIFTPATGGTPLDVTDDALPAGQGTEGNQFEFSGGKWQFNLKTQNYTSQGTYTTYPLSLDVRRSTPSTRAAQSISRSIRSIFKRWGGYIDKRT